MYTYEITEEDNDIVVLIKDKNNEITMKRFYDSNGSKFLNEDDAKIWAEKKVFGLNKEISKERNLNIYIKDINSTNINQLKIETPYEWILEIKDENKEYINKSYTVSIPIINKSNGNIEDFLDIHVENGVGNTEYTFKNKGFYKIDENNIINSNNSTKEIFNKISFPDIMVK